MRANIFNLLEMINKLGYDNTQWGCCEDINTSWYFGSKEEIELKGHHIYLYVDDLDIDFILETCKARPNRVIEVENSTIFIYKA